MALGGGGGGATLTMGAFDGQPGAAEGASIVAAQLFMQSATASVPGSVNISTQTFSGQKTFATGLTGTLTGHATLDVPLSSLGNLTDAGTDGIVVTGGTGATVGSVSLAQHVADSTHNGYLSSTDWNTFNNKQSTLTLGNLTDVGTDGITVTGGTGAVVGAGTSLSQHVADSTHNGYLSSTDWSTFNSKQAAGNYITALTGDVTATGPGSVASTVAKIQGVTVSGTTGTTNVVFSNTPTLVTPVIGAATGTSLSVSGQLTSTVATGTAPLVVSSTTQVANLNAATAGTATNATNVATTATNSTNATFFPTFVASSSSGNQGIDTATGLTFNPALNTLTTAILVAQDDNIGTTSTDAHVALNSTAAGAGAQQYSPRMRLTGQGWRTASGGSSQSVDWIAQTVPVQGVANPTSYLDFSAQVNAGGYANVLALTSTGFVGVGITAPTTALTVNSTTATLVDILDLADSTIGIDWKFALGNKYSLAAKSLAMYSSSNGGADFAINPSTGLATPPFVIKSTGKVGLNTTSPGAMLSLVPTATFAAAAATGINIGTHTITLSGVDPSTYATMSAENIGAMTLTGTNANQTVTNAAALNVASAPVKSTNVAITNTHGVLVASGAVSTATNSYGLSVNAQTGATNNYAAQFIGGNVGVGTASPTKTLDVTGTLGVSGNANANNFLPGFTTTATAAGTTTLTINSTNIQVFTGATTQTVTLPVVSTLVTGFPFTIVNQSSGVVTVQSSGANTLQAMAANTEMQIICVSTSGTGTASWVWLYENINAAVPMVNPMTTGGDIIYGGASGTPTRLANGSSAQYLASSGGTTAPVWTSFAAPTIQKFTSTGTTTGWFFTVTSANATVGATYTNNGNTYTVLATIASATQLFTSQASAPQTSGTLTKASGSGDATITFSSRLALATYTTSTSPRTPLYLRVRLVGGGGGGSGSGTGDGGNGNTGQPTAFGAGLIIGQGGVAGGNQSGGVGGTASLGSGPIGSAFTGAKGGAGMGESINTVDPLPGIGGMTSFFGGAGGPPVGTSPGTNGAVNTGAGGSGASSSAAIGRTQGSGGGGAGAVDCLVSSPSATYVYLVGGGGGGGSAGTSGQGGGGGADGYIEVTEYYQ